MLLIPGCVKERITVRGSDQLGAGFAAGIGVEAPQRIIFPVTPLPLLVLVAFISCNVDYGFNRARLKIVLAYRFEHMHRT
ncbi:hypothetical protein D3C81_1861970 [compost metagenome]